MKNLIKKVIYDSKQIISANKYRRMAFGANNDDKRLLVANRNTLSSEDIELIGQIWSKIIPNIQLGLCGFMVFKQYADFSPYFVPSAYYYPYIIRALNPSNYYKAFINKCLTENLFPNIPQPETIAKRVNGNYFIGNDLLSDIEHIINYIKEYQDNILLKQAVESCCGRNIRILDVGSASKAEIQAALAIYDKDFIIQGIVKQSSQTEIFNPSSLNTFRISTLFINGNISVCSRAIKFGKPGNFVDNIGGDGGGIIVGITPEGNLNDWGITSNGEIRTTHNGIPFGGINIPSFDLVIQTAIEAHKQLPYCGIVGWDIALDSTNSPVLIEANLWWPGTLLEQICSGPFFGERTTEVIDYICHLKENKYISLSD